MNKSLLFLFVVIFSFLFPIILYIWWKKKNECGWAAFVVGVICFLLFANTIESFVHYYFLMTNKTTAAFFNSTPIAYAIYGAVMAGLFEETGRLVGFKFFLSNHKEKETSVGYGIGHGGVECFLVLGMTYLTYFVVANGGTLGDAALDASALQSIELINIGIIPVAIAERISAMMIHIGLSIMVFRAVNEKGSIKYFPIAIALHIISDIPAGMYQAGLINSVVIVEVFTIAISICILFYAIKMYQDMEFDYEDYGDLENEVSIDEDDEE